MNRQILLLSVFILTLNSCGISTQREIEYFTENKVSFFDLRNEDLISNSWIRKPENLLMVHETLKKYGYNDLLNEIWIDENSFSFKSIIIRKNIYEWRDSLLLTFNQGSIKSKYYHDFWERRKNENIDTLVYQILTDIKSVGTKEANSYISSSELVNDTLLRLLEVEFRFDSITERIANQNFDTLVKYGFHESAYNLLYERYEYYDINWNEEEMKMRLMKSDTYEGAWLVDNTK